MCDDCAGDFSLKQTMRPHGHSMVEAWAKHGRFTKSRQARAAIESKEGPRGWRAAGARAPLKRQPRALRSHAGRPLVLISESSSGRQGRVPTRRSGKRGRYIG